MARSKMKSISHHDTSHLQRQPMYQPSMKFPHLTVSDIYPRQDIVSHHPPTQQDGMGEKNTYTMFKGCEVKSDHKCKTHSELSRLPMKM